MSEGVFLNTWLSAEDKETIQDAAKKWGMSTSAFVRMAALEQAKTANKLYEGYMDAKDES